MEGRILNQMSSVEGGIGYKTEEYIERSHHVGKNLERRYKYATDFIQSQPSQIKIQYLLSNPIVKMKSEQVKEEILRKFKRKR